MINFMKMRTFYKKLPFFIKKNCPLLFIKNSMLQIVIYKKLNFWEECTPLLSLTHKSAFFGGILFCSLVIAWYWFSAWNLYIYSSFSLSLCLFFFNTPFLWNEKCIRGVRLSYENRNGTQIMPCGLNINSQNLSCVSLFSP